MANISKNIQNVRFLRNGSLFASHAEALTALTAKGSSAGAEQDGTIILARYTDKDSDVKTLAGLVYASGNSKSITIIDIEGASADVEALRTEINNKLGEGVSSANTVTAQLTALSGNSSTDTSATTSVEGAKKYADAKIGELDYTGVTTGDGVYVTNVTQADGTIAATTDVLPTVATITEAGKPIIAVAEDKGTITASAGTIDAQYVDVTGFTATTVQGALEEVKANIGEAISGLDVSDEAVPGEYVSQVSETDGKISVTRVALPSSADTAVAKKVVVAVAEDKGQIEVSRGSITSSGKTIVLTDNADGGVNFEANVDGTTIIVDENTGTMSVASSALVQYEGDGKTVQISAVQNGVRTVSSPLTISSTTVTDTNVKEQFNLVNASGETVGATIKIYKDSSLYSVYLGHVDDGLSDNTDPTSIVEGTGSEALCFIYHKEDGTYELVTVDVEAFLMESEFASGVTADGTTHIVHGVVDPTSESFLTVGADGFKISGVSGLVTNAIEALDADVSGNTTHVTVNVVEADGVITGVNVAEDNIANASDLAVLSAKTITDIDSANGSITVTPANAADGTQEIDLATDASKIKMSGFTATQSGFTAITEDTTITDAVKAIETAIIDNEEVVSTALNDLNEKIASGVSAASTVVAEGNDAGNNMEIVKTTDSTDGHAIYTINLSDVASASAMTAEIAARKAIDGQTGQTYAANSSSPYISGATDLNDADVKLAAALKSLSDETVNQVKVNNVALTEADNAVNVQIASAPVTGLTASPITVATDDSTGAVTLRFEDLDAGTY